MLLIYIIINSDIKYKMDQIDLSDIKSLDTINNFPHIGLMYFENSGENLLRYYLEQIFKIKTQSNIKAEFCQSSCFFPKTQQDLNLSWVIASDFPTRAFYEYETIDIAMGIILIRNPIDVIMSLVLKDSVLLEEALNKLDELINNWKVFYKYWLKAPIPVYIVKYEELIDDPENILKDLARFMLGIKYVDGTKLDYAIKKARLSKIEDYYYAYIADIKNISTLDEEIHRKIKKKFSIVDNLSDKLKYSNKNQYRNWLDDFNKENLVKSVNLQEMISNSILTSTYYTLRLC